MNISKFSIKRPVTTAMLMVIIILLGAVSFFRIPLDLFPKMEIPMALAIVTYPNASPEEIESLITKPVEKQLAAVENLKTLTSVSSEGSSLMVIQFENGTDMNFATLDMREKIALVQDYLPEQASAPIVIKLNPDMMPIMMLFVSADTDLSTLNTIVEDNVLPAFERAEGVASADIFGGMEKEIQVVMNQEKLTGYGLSLSQISGILASENINLPSGDIEKGSNKLLVRTIGEFTTVEEVANTPILLSSGELIYLHDVATVTDSYKDQSTLGRVNGAPAIGITITKQSLSNTVTTSKGLMEKIEQLKETYPDLNITIGFNQADFITSAISGVAESAIIGCLLAVLILFLFLRNFMSTLIIAIAVPVSIIATFALMFFNGLTLNIVSLGGLSLGVGMLVDNSIVVLENIYRLREEGLSLNQASAQGATEVTSAIFSSTMTTIAVFLPIVFTEGIAGILFRDMSFTITFSLLSSLIIALTVVPMLSSKYLHLTPALNQKLEDVENNQVLIIPKKKQVYLDKFFGIFSHVVDKYQSLLHYGLGHRKITIIVSIGIFLMSLGLVSIVGGELIPTSDEGSIDITVETPYGTSINETDKIVTEIENYIMTIPELETCSSSIGNAANMMASSNSSSITATLINKNERNRTDKEVAEDIRTEFANMTKAKISVDVSSSFSMAMGSSSPIQISLQGNDLETLKTISEDFKYAIESIPGASNVETNIKEGSPEVRVHLNRNKASLYGISSATMAKTLNNALSGTKASVLKKDGNEIDITLSVDNEYSKSVENMKRLLIPSLTGAAIPLGEIADIEYGNSPSQINRQDQVRTVTISADTNGRDLKSVSKDVVEKLSAFNLPLGYSYDISGQQEEMTDAFSDLALAAFLGICLIFMILAAQFESLIQPLIIMMSIPFAFTGAFLGLFVTGTPLSITAFIGLIVLLGIVVNNAILLIDFINQSRHAGVPRNEAIMTAAKNRIRPIFMTMLTTVLGMLPLSLGFGDGGELVAPMGITVIGGLLLSTLVTLIFIPVLYSSIEDISIKYFKGKGVSEWSN